MYRLRNNNIKIVKILLFLGSTLVLIPPCFSGELNLTPLNFLNKWVNTAEKNLESNSAKGKAVVKDLYSNSLKQASLLKMSPMLTAVKATTYTLNNTYRCNLKDNDTINILYKSNDDFRKNLNNASSNFDKPVKDDMVNSCSILMSCVLSSSDGTKIADIVSYCKIIVNDFYLNEYKKDYNSSSLLKGNDGLDAFWNNTLKDSSYDILNDIYVLAKILFDTPKEPEQVLYYEMPDVSPNTNNVTTSTPIEKDRFSPYFKTNQRSGSDGGSGNNQTPKPNGGAGSAQGSMTVGNPEGSITIHQDSDNTDIETFIREISEMGLSATESSNGYDFLGQNEQCINLDSNENSATPENPVTPDNPTNPENPATPENPNTPENPATPENPTNPEIPTEPENPPEPEPEPEIPLEPEYAEFSGDEEVLTCFSSCKDIPCTAKSCDRLACYTKCLCLSYESSIFDPTMNPGLGPIFKLKFCLQPVQDTTVPSSKKAYNLETIIKEINTVIQNLRNSGQLMLNKKTKELLDAGFQNVKFTQTTPRIDGYSKEPESIGSEKQEKENQKQLNTLMMENMLGFEQDPTVDSLLRDKYVIKGGNQDAGSIRKVGIQTGIFDTYIDNSIFVSALQSEHLTDMGFQISEFLDSNLQFWISFKESLTSMNNIAKALLNKK